MRILKVIFSAILQKKTYILKKNHNFNALQWIFMKQSDIWSSKYGITEKTTWMPYNEISWDQEAFEVWDMSFRRKNASGSEIQGQMRAKVWKITKLIFFPKNCIFTKNTRIEMYFTKILNPLRIFQLLVFSDNSRPKDIYFWNSIFQKIIIFFLWNPRKNSSIRYYEYVVFGKAFTCSSKIWKRGKVWKDTKSPFLPAFCKEALEL